MVVARWMGATRPRRTSWAVRVILPQLFISAARASRSASTGLPPSGSGVTLFATASFARSMVSS